MSQRYFLRTREQYENAPVGTEVRCDLFDDCRFKRIDGGWRHGRSRGIRQLGPCRREVIRWGDR